VPTLCNADQRYKNRVPSAIKSPPFNTKLIHDPHIDFELNVIAVDKGGY
jgi:hypothetical protein